MTAIVVAGLVGSSVGVYRSVRGSISTSEWVTHTYQVIDTLDTLLGLLVDAETGQRGYVLSQRKEFLEPYNRALPRIAPTVDLIARLTADNPSQQARIPALRRQTANRLDLLTTDVQELQRTSRTVVPLLPRVDEGKRLMDENRALIADMRRDEVILLDARSANWRSSARRQGWLTMGFLSLVSVSLAASAVLATRDARARRNAVDAQARLAAIVDATTDSVVSVDAAGTIISWNHGATRIYGFTQEEMLGRSAGVLSPDDRKHEFPDLLTRVSSGQAIPGYQAVRVRKDGSPVHISVSVSPFRNGPNQFIAFISQDVTDRVRSEEKLSRYRLELERSNQDLQDFAAIASHDLQEPLRKITAFGDLLTEHAGPHLDAESRDYLDRITAASRRMRALIEGLLVLARVTTQARPFETTDLNIVASEVLADLDQRVQDVGGRVEVGTLPVLQADALQMRQLLQNLVANALKFSRAGVPPVVVIDAIPADVDGWTIRVADNGIGFDEKYLDRIFKPFQRLHGRNEFEGSGMGLAICDKIAARHGGTLTARSTPGLGTTFMATLSSQPRG